MLSIKLHLFNWKNNFVTNFRPLFHAHVPVARVSGPCAAAVRVGAGPHTYMMGRSVTGVFSPAAKLCEPPGVTEPPVTEPPSYMCVWRRNLKVQPV